MASQTMDDVMGVYMTVIEDTIQRCRNIQNAAVLDQVRERWIANLHERIRQTQQARQTDKAVRANPSGRPSVRLVPGFDKIKIKIKADLDDQPVPQRHTLSEVFAEQKMSRLQGRPQASPSAEGLWSNVATEGSADSKSIPTQSAGQENVDEDGADGEDEGWGDWEDPESSKPEEVTHVTEGATEIPNDSNRPPEEEATAPTEGYVDAHGNYLPTEADFATRVTTAYGRGNPMLNGSNALHWDKPDEIDSDLDNVSDLSDDEPNARDSVIGQFESVLKPVGRKATSSGLWKIRVKNGIAKIDGQEFFFDTLNADLEF